MIIPESCRKQSNLYMIDGIIGISLLLPSNASLVKLAQNFSPFLPLSSNQSFFRISIEVSFQSFHASLYHIRICHSLQRLHYFHLSGLVTSHIFFGLSSGIIISWTPRRNSIKPSVLMWDMFDRGEIIAFISWSRNVKQCRRVVSSHEDDGSKQQEVADESRIRIHLRCAMNRNLFLSKAYSE